MEPSPSSGSQDDVPELPEEQPQPMVPLPIKPQTPVLCLDDDDDDDDDDAAINDVVEQVEKREEERNDIEYDAMQQQQALDPSGFNFFLLSLSLTFLSFCPAPCCIVCTHSHDDPG